MPTGAPTIIQAHALLLSSLLAALVPVAAAACCCRPPCPLSPSPLLLLSRPLPPPLPLSSPPLPLAPPLLPLPPLSPLSRRLPVSSGPRIPPAAGLSAMSSESSKPAAEQQQAERLLAQAMAECTMAASAATSESPKISTEGGPPPQQSMGNATEPGSTPIGEELHLASSANTGLRTRNLSSIPLEKPAPLPS